MNLRILTWLAASLLAGSVPVIAQDSGGIQEPAAKKPNAAMVDTTFTADDGTLLRFRGSRPAAELPGGPERFAANPDDRVPLGYGWRSVSEWREGDPRPEPRYEAGRVTTEFMDLHCDADLDAPVAKTFAEVGDYMYFAVKDRLGWTLDKPITVIAAKDIEQYTRRYGLPWWIPCEVRGDTILVEAIQAIVGRGIALESMTHSYAELQIRRKTGDRVPNWFIYGAGAFLGGEGWILKGQVENLKAPQWNVEIDQATMINDLEIFRDAKLMMKEAEHPGSLETERTKSRIAFWRAFRLVEDIMLKKGIGPFKQLIEMMAADPALSFDDAVEKAYGMSVDALVAAHAPW